jgi:hypothetical protein
MTMKGQEEKTLDQPDGVDESEWDDLIQYSDWLDIVTELYIIDVIINNLNRLRLINEKA